jgi:4-hydroxybenzoate polyprenyltransferase
VAAGLAGDGGIMYWTGALTFIALLVYQHSIVKPEDLSRVNLAFGTTNGIAGVLFGILMITDLLIR